ncbi:MAG: hypothetical protein AAF554_02265 [Bacteroidota bacterium]
MKSALLLIPVLILMLLGCTSKKEQQVYQIKNKYWNLDTGDLNELELLSDMPLYFSESDIYFNNGKLSKYQLKGASLTIADTFYLGKGHALNTNKSNEGSDRSICYIKTIKGDSLYRIIDTYFRGRIHRISNDSLELKGSGFGVPFQYEENLKFYNDSLAINRDMQVDSLKFSIFSCNGGIRDYKAVLRSDKTVEVWFDYFSESGTYIKKEIDNQRWNELLGMIRISNIHKMVPKQYLASDDPFFYIEIYSKDDTPQRVNGLMELYPLRVQNLVLSLDETIKTLSLEFGENN